MKSPREIVESMLAGDEFSRWLGLELLQIDQGQCELRMSVRKEMLNGFGILHGGITYSMADSALAFAANSYGIQSLTLETSISHHRKVMIDELITARTFEIHKGSNVSSFQVEITNAQDQIVASFKGTVLHTKKHW